MRRLLLGALLVACNPYAGGLGQGGGSNGGSGSGTSGGTSTGGEPSTTVVVDGSGSTSAGTTTSSTTTATTDGSTGASESGTTGELPPTAQSCAELLAQDPATPTGVHSIVRPSDGAVMPVHCEMEVDDGGWTLVARSEAGVVQGSFGWGEATGSLDDGTMPYSLDVVDVGLAFTEILVTRRMGFATPRDNAFAITVPPTFVADYADSQLSHMSLRVVLGACTPNTMSMLRRVGYTNNDDSFYLRDTQFNDIYGLRSDGFSLNYDDCDLGAGLNDRQGALFVR